MLLNNKNKIAYVAILIILAIFALIMLIISNRINTQKSIDPRSSAEVTNLPTISINTNSELGVFKQGLSANNIEAGLPLWPKEKNIQFQNLAASESLIQNAKYSRFPMGCIVDIYPFPRDPSNWQLLDQPQYGGTYGRFNLKDWLDYIANSQSEPIITVNTQGRHPYKSCVNGPYFEGTAEDAANMVQFFNKPNDGSSPWATLRASFGYPNPIGVKYWQIGNEPYSDNREGGTNFKTIEARVENYAQTVVEFSNRMKQVDPTIKIVAVVEAHSGSPLINGVRHMPPLTPQFYKDKLYLALGFEQSIDMVSVHNEQRGGCDDETAFVHALTRQNERTETLRSLYSGKMIYFDETSLCTDPKKANLSLLFGNVTALMEMARKGVDISAYWYLVTYMQENSTFQETAGTVFTYDLTQNFKTPVYYFHKDYIGLLLNKKIIQTTITNNEKFNYIWDVSVRGDCPVTDGCPVSTPNVPFQTALAVKNDKGDKVYLLVVNIKNQETTIQVNMNEGYYSNAVKTYTISGNSFLDQNTLVNPNNVSTRINNEVLERVAGGFTKTFDKYSVTLVEFNIESTPTGTVADPTFSPVAGTYINAQTVTISSATAGSTIRYTTNGTTPSQTNGTVYSGAITLTATTTLKAIAYKTGMTNSNVASATYTNISISTNRVATPVISPTATAFTTSVSVSITTATAGATIRYTTNGTTPSLTNGMVYKGAFTLTSQTTVKAIAYNTGMTNSYIATKTYTNRVAKPVISPTTTTFTTSVSVSLSTATAGATIRYTTNGTTPSTTNGTEYTGAFTLTSQTTVKAIAYKTGMTNSYIATRTYTNRVARPIISPTTTAFTTSVSVSITTATVGATIRYTTNGTTPSLTNGTVYTAPFTLTSQTTVKAIAYKTGMTNSFVASRSYTKSTTTSNRVPYYLNDGLLRANYEN